MKKIPEPPKFEARPDGRCKECGACAYDCVHYGARMMWEDYERRRLAAERDAKIANEGGPDVKGI